MTRIKISLPQHFSFITQLIVRITDINYGGHLGNDAVLSLMHEARLQFLQHYGFTELNFAGTGLIMSDVAIEFKAEAFYGDVLEVSMAATGFTRAGFELYYQFVKKLNDVTVIIARAKTSMICFDYDLKKVMPMPAGAIKKLTN